MGFSVPNFLDVHSIGKKSVKEEAARSGNDDVRLQSIYRRVLSEEFDFSYRIQIKL